MLGKDSARMRRSVTRTSSEALAFPVEPAI